MRLPRAARAGLCLLLGIISAMCFVIDGAGFVARSDAPAGSASALWSALAICFAALLWHVFEGKKLRLYPAAAVFALLFGLVNAFGVRLYAYDTWTMSKARLLLTCAQGVGQAVPMAAALTWVDGALRAPMRGRLRMERFERHELLWSMAAMLVCWLPYLIAYYPGSVCWDLGEMIAQFFGQREMDTWHPVFTTWIIGSLVWIGRRFGSENMGAALYTALQTGLLAYALARALQYLKQKNICLELRLAGLAFFALVPLWAGYAQFVNKDTMYTASLLLFTLNVLCLLDGRCTRRAAAEMFGFGLLTCLLRSNGIYVILPSSVVTVLFAVRGRDRVRIGAALTACVACALLFQNALIPALGIRDETASGIYSVCFQQSARVLRDHPDTVTEEEYAEIDRVLNAQKIPNVYEPWISDPVKFTFRQYGQGAAAEKEALRRYSRTWLSMLKKYPLTYLEAFFAGNISYYTFTPKLESMRTFNNQAGNRIVFDTPVLGDDPRLLHTRQIPALEKARNLLAQLALGWRRIPVLGLLYVCALYTWVLVGAALSACRRGRWRLLTAFVPALMSLGVCMLGPVNDYFRYFLPIVAMTIPLLAACAKERAQ